MAGLQGYSFAKFGARYPSAGGLLEYVARGFGDGHFTGIIAWLVLATNAIVTGMVAVSFGSYASSALNLDGQAAVKGFAILIVAVMTLLNILGSQAVVRIQTLIVFVVLGILTLFAVVTLVNLNPHLLAFSGYPPIPGHRVECGAHVLRLPGLRHHHLHREGSAAPVAAVTTSDGTGPGHCHSHLRRRVSRACSARSPWTK